MAYNYEDPFFFFKNKIYMIMQPSIHCNEGEPLYTHEWIVFELGKEG